MMLDSGNVLCRTTLCEVEMHERILRLITSQQIGKEAGANEEEMPIRTTPTSPRPAAPASFKAYSMRPIAMRA
jgi:hypothetical protein